MRTTNPFTSEPRVKAAVGNRGLPPISRAMFLAAGLVWLVGCEAENVKTVPSQQIKHAKTAETMEPDSDVLPPQSEPPIADEKSPSEDPAKTSKEKTEPAEGKDPDSKEDKSKSSQSDTEKSETKE